MGIGYVFRNIGYNIKQTCSKVETAIQESKFGQQMARWGFQRAIKPHPLMNRINKLLSAVAGKVSQETINGSLQEKSIAPSYMPTFIKNKHINIVNDLAKKIDWDENDPSTAKRQDLSPRDLNRLVRATKYLPQGSEAYKKAQAMVRGAMDYVIVDRLQRRGFFPGDKLTQNLHEDALRKLTAAAKLFPQEVANAVKELPKSSQLVFDSQDARSFTGADLEEIATQMKNAQMKLPETKEEFQQLSRELTAFFYVSNSNVEEVKREAYDYMWNTQNMKIRETFGQFIKWKKENPQKADEILNQGIDFYSLGSENTAYVDKSGQYVNRLKEAIETFSERQSGWQDLQKLLPKEKSSASGATANNSFSIKVPTKKNHKTKTPKHTNKVPKELEELGISSKNIGALNQAAGFDITGPDVSKILKETGINEDLKNLNEAFKELGQPNKDV